MRALAIFALEPRRDKREKKFTLPFHFLLKFPQSCESQEDFASLVNQEFAESSTVPTVAPCLSNLLRCYFSYLHFFRNR